MSVSEVAAATNKSETTIRYWMKKFNMEEVDLDKLKEIKRMAAAGYTLPRIKHKLNERTFKRA